MVLQQESVPNKISMTILYSGLKNCFSRMQPVYLIEFIYVSCLIVF